MSKCKDNRLSEEDIKIQEFYDKQFQKEGFTSEMGYDQYKGNWAKLIDLFKTNKPVTEAQVRKKAKTLLKPGKGEAAILGLNIATILNNNQHLQKHMNQYMTEEIVVRNIKAKFTDVDGNRVPLIDSLPIDALRVFHNTLHRWVNDGRNYKQTRGLIGTMYYEWGSTRQNMKLDNSGVHADINNIAENYPAQAATWSKQFVVSKQRKMVKTKGAGNQPYGFQSIVEDLSLWNINSNLPEQAGWRLFSEVMKGRAVVQKDGSIIRYNEWTPMTEGGMQVFKWNPKSAELGFRYIDENGKEAILNGLSNKITPGREQVAPQFNEFAKIIAQTRELLFSVGTEAQKEINAQVKERQQLKKEIDKSEFKDYIYNNMEDIYDSEMEIGGMNTARLKEDNYYPNMYLSATLVPQFENSIQKQETALVEKEALYYDPNSKLTPKQKGDLITDIRNHNISIALLNEKRKMMMDPSMAKDPEGVPMKTSVWYKNFKEVSNVMDPDMARTDEDVVLDYVTKLGQQIVRNDAVNRAMRSVFEAKKRGAKDHQTGAAIDTFNVTFYNPNSHSQIFGVDMTSKKWAQRLSAFGATEEGINEFAKGYSSFTTTSLLYGPQQGLVNYSAVLLKAEITGLKELTDATNELTGPRKEFWQGEVEKAGIGTFSDFVNTYFNVALRPSEIKAYNHEIKRLNAIIKRNENSNNAGEIIKYQKTYLKRIKNRRIQNTLDAAAQYVIDRKNYVRNNQNFLFRIFTGTKGFFAGLFPSIGETETLLRSQSYIIGAKKAVQRGYANSLTDARARQMGIAHTMMTDFGLTQTSVGTALRGPIAGATLNKMKIWHNQKMGFDYRMWRDAAIAKTDTLKSLYKLRLTGNMALMLGNAMTVEPIFAMGARLKGQRRYRITREAAPFNAAYNATTLRQGMISLLFDVMTFGPGANFARSIVPGFMRTMFRAATGGGYAVRGLQGAGSAMLSGLAAVAALGWSAAMGDEEESWDEKLWKFYRYSPFGVGMSMVVSGALYAAHKTKQLDTTYDRYGRNFTRPILGPFDDLAWWAIEAGSEEYAKRVAD